tara:strand:+ start:74 stop:334 length:261 start_codon:yes stop_codon:yes gene_type:complete
MAKTQRELIDDLQDNLNDLKNVVKYEAVERIKAMDKDLRSLKKQANEYDVMKERLNLIYKSSTWVVTVVFGAILLAVVNLVLRSPT